MAECDGTSPRVVARVAPKGGPILAIPTAEGTTIQDECFGTHGDITCEKNLGVLGDLGAVGSAAEGIRMAGNGRGAELGVGDAGVCVVSRDFPDIAGSRLNIKAATPAIDAGKLVEIRPATGTALQSEALGEGSDIARQGERCIPGDNGGSATSQRNRAVGTRRRVSRVSKSGRAPADSQRDGGTSPHRGSHPGIRDRVEGKPLGGTVHDEISREGV